MNSTSTTTGRLLGHEECPEAYVGLAGLHRMNPPIYAALVVEWLARGRTLPGWPDPQWTTLTAPPVIGRQVTVNSKTDMGRWKRAAVAAPGADRSG
ncbi:hypothetical protein ACWC09_35055 [Streptomyces sp. NPDC001617]